MTDAELVARLLGCNPGQDRFSEAYLRPLLDECAARLAAVCEERDRAQGRNICDVCAGTGALASGQQCACGGTGRMSDAALYLRTRLYDAEAERDKLREALRAHAMGHSYATDEDAAEDRPCKGHCMECDSEWELPGQERHAPGCLAALNTELMP